MQHIVSEAWQNTSNYTATTSQRTERLGVYTKILTCTTTKHRWKY